MDILHDFLEVQKQVYVKWDTILNMLDISINAVTKTENLTEEEKLNWLCGLEYFRDNLNEQTGKFASEIELEGLGLGDGKTKMTVLKVIK